MLGDPSVHVGTQSDRDGAPPGQQRLDERGAAIWILPVGEQLSNRSTTRSSPASPPAILSAGSLLGVTR
jgi:hypothetical protein